MSRFFDGLRAKLSSHFVLRDAAAAPVTDTHDVTFSAFLPHEQATVAMLTRISAIRRLANGHAVRLKSKAELRRAAGLPWQLIMTFYVGTGAAEYAALEGKIADVALALGGSLTGVKATASRTGRRRAA